MHGGKQEDRCPAASEPPLRRQAGGNCRLPPQEPPLRKLHPFLSSSEQRGRGKGEPPVTDSLYLQHCCCRGSLAELRLGSNTDGLSFLDRAPATPSKRSSTLDVTADKNFPMEKTKGERDCSERGSSFCLQTLLSSTAEGRRFASPTAAAIKSFLMQQPRQNDSGASPLLPKPSCSSF